MLDVLIAEQLHVDRIAGPDHVVDRYWSFVIDRERIRSFRFKELVSELPQRGDAHWIERQERQNDGERT